MKRNVIKIMGISAYIAFILFSFITGFDPGKQIGENFVTFSVDMLKILPCAFILIGLFEVWVKKETVEKHFGKEAGMRGYMWVVLLASTTVGGLYVAFPVAYSLYNKGAKLSVIFTYIGASAICRVPMTIFEASFMGIKFSSIRLLVSLPLVIISSILLGDYLEKRNYKIMKGK
ncbi:MAG: putative membrane protein YraQ [Thermodesulfobacterium sp.]|uniref:Membrane protein YraQ n=1 Tax=Candidatus Thermodesulfobacterium syntrophicum TaxID=3060442 RepID=A0AAE3P5B3_9BACT|nr:putative membrane protein YraQ [Candidatus Thermodesulfobacterium syntrophicum]